MDLLRLIPTCPKSLQIHKLQAPLLYATAPGQWSRGCLQRLFGIPPNFHREEWIIRLNSGGRPDSADVMRSLRKCEELREQPTSAKHIALRQADFVVHRLSVHSLVAFFFTPYKQWLDACEVTVVEDSDDSLRISAYSFSASVIPAAFPLALLFALLLFWIPFGDMGQNKIHLCALRKLLTDDGMEVEVVDSRAGRRQ